jgi:pimeloyl-ACP methyl ester carboxylesterase
MEEFEIVNRYGLKIIGEVTRPENPIGCAFIMHGLGGRKEEKHMLLFAKILISHNYTTVNFDATNATGESEGKYEDATMQRHYEDLVDVITWAKTQPWFREPFLLAGHSMGGFAVTKYAEEFSEEVKALFPFAAVYSGEDSFEASRKFRPEELKDWEETGWVDRTSTTKPDLELRLPWSHMEERLKHDLKDRVDKLTMPVLFVVGEEDIRCPPYQQENFFNLLIKNTNKEFHIIPRAPHTFREQEHLDELEKIFSNWLTKIS